MGLVFLWQDRSDKEPVRLVLITFVAGMVAVVPAALIELPFRGYLTEPANLLVRFLVALFVVGLGDEARQVVGGDRHSL